MRIIEAEFKAKVKNGWTYFWLSRKNAKQDFPEWFSSFWSRKKMSIRFLHWRLGPKKWCRWAPTPKTTPDLWFENVWLDSLHLWLLFTIRSVGRWPMEAIRRKWIINAAWLAMFSLFYWMKWSRVGFDKIPSNVNGRIWKQILETFLAICLHILDFRRTCRRSEHQIRSWKTVPVEAALERLWKAPFGNLYFGRNKKFTIFEA